MPRAVFADLFYTCSPLKSFIGPFSLLIFFLEIPSGWIQYSHCPVPPSLYSHHRLPSANARTLEYLLLKQSQSCLLLLLLDFPVSIALRVARSVYMCFGISSNPAWRIRIGSVVQYRYFLLFSRFRLPSAICQTSALPWPGIIAFRTPPFLFFFAFRRIPTALCRTLFGSLRYCIGVLSLHFLWKFQTFFVCFFLFVLLL